MYLSHWKSEADFKKLIASYIEERRPYLLHETERDFKKRTYRYVKSKLLTNYEFDPITWIFIVYKIYTIIRFLIDTFYATNAKSPDN
mgnify:CR=1 FL=1